MKKVGIIGWRGMVGSVLIERMSACEDFSKIKSYLFSTSLKGSSAPSYPNCHDLILDSNDIEKLMEMEIILTSQGSSYTEFVHPKLRSLGWNGLWIDAASSLRMKENALIVLDPINSEHIQHGLNSGVKDFVGGNCTVSLMLMGVGALFKEDLVEWMTSMTYQAASGSGAKAMIELLDQMKYTADNYINYKDDPAMGALDIEKNLTKSFQDNHFPKESFGAPLNLSLLPWIDSKLANGQSREEWKAQAETNKILSHSRVVPIDGTCVRVGSLRCHSQALTIKLKKSVSTNAIEELIQNSNPWVKFVENEKEATLKNLTPASVSGSLTVPVGRVRKMTLGDDFLNVFTLGDQLLWGAAEPLRRMLAMAIE